MARVRVVTVMKIITVNTKKNELVHYSINTGLTITSKNGFTAHAIALHAAVMLRVKGMGYIHRSTDSIPS